MFENLEQNKIEEEEDDSETWPYSYPSYSRFTFTGKTKSRLGRSSRHSRKPVNKDEVNIKEDNSNCEVPSNPHLPATRTGQDHQYSINDNAVDVSSQSNFFFSLKNDSIQSSNCKRNLAFTTTPFKSGETQKNNMSNQNQLTKLPPISNLKFPLEENKENAVDENISDELKSNGKISFDPSWSQFKRICDGNIPFAPLTAKTLEVNELADLGVRNPFGQAVNEPFNPLNIFNAIGSRRNDRKENDDHFNTPLDLSSGENLTNKTFNRSITGGSDDTPFSAEATSSTYPQTVVPQQGKDTCMKSDDGMKPKNYSEDINSILPAFLIPTNKNRYNNNRSLSDDKLKSSPQTVFNAALFSSQTLKPDALNALSHSTLAQSHNSQDSSLKGSQNTDSHFLNVQNNSEKTLLPAYKLPSTVTMPSSEIVDGHVKGSMKDSSKPIEQFNQELVKNSNQDNMLPSQPVDNIFLRRESWIGLKTENQPLVSQYSNLKTSDEESKAASEPNKPTKNVYEKTHTTLQTESLTKSHDPPENVAINNFNEIRSKDQEKLSTVSSSNNDLAAKPSVSEVNRPTPIHNHIPVQQLNESEVLKMRSALTSVVSSQPVESVSERVNQNMYHPPQHAPSDPFTRQNSRQQAGDGPRLPEQGCQKTYLAPHAPVEQRNVHKFPHVKPEISQQSRPHFAAPKKPQNTFKMPGSQGLLSRVNAELYVNGRMYTILSMLGRGGSSEVYQVLDPRSSKLMAVKCVDLSMVDKTIADGYLNEIDLLSKLQGCASVIRMFDYEYVEENKMLYVVMEKGDTDLSQLIRDISKTKKISMSMIIYYWTEMVNAVKDIHEQGIIHSDLKPANFLLVSGRLKLIDFGIASSQGDMTSVVKEVTTGTWNYMSPEAIRNTSSNGKGFKITYKSDVWSLGCILYNLVYGKTPFSHITNTWGKLQAIADSTHRIDFPEVGAPAVLAAALRSCFHRDPKQRPTVAELLALPYHASTDSNHIGRQLVNILPPDWWAKVSHLFPDLKPSPEKKDLAQSTA